MTRHLPESEADLQRAVIELAEVYGWRVAHFRPARTAAGWRTAVSGAGAGFPDLTLVRPPELIFAELKGERGRVRLEQEAWLEALEAVRVAVRRVNRVALTRASQPAHTELPAIDVYTWRPSDWPEIQARLRPRG